MGATCFLALSVAYSTVQDYVRRATAKGLKYQQLLKMSDAKENNSAKDTLKSVSEILIHPMSDSVTERLDRIEATTERTANNLEVLTHQIGVLTEGITDMKASMSEGFADIRTSLQELNKNAERQETNIERQEQNINRLVGIVETLINQSVK